MECEFCNKSFATKIVLKTHQSKAKYCLKLQNKKSEETFQCIYCSKSFKPFFVIGYFNEQLMQNIYEF